MAQNHRKDQATFSTHLIAPCGMNCHLCHGFIRETNSCPGCRGNEEYESQKSQYRKRCKIRNCELIVSGQLDHCSEKCNRYPCNPLKQLDKRYRAKYSMSMIDNLKMLSENGIDHFFQIEKNRWTCPKCSEIICVHKPTCISCGYEWM